MRCTYCIGGVNYEIRDKPQSCTECNGTGLKSEMEEKKDIKEFESGAKSSGNLPPYECLTETFIDRCARRMELGAKNYGKHNWKKGARDKEFILNRLRHACKHLGLLMQSIDENIPTFDDDAAAVCVNVMMAMEYQQPKKFTAEELQALLTD